MYVNVIPEASQGLLFPEVFFQADAGQQGLEARLLAFIEAHPLDIFRLLFDGRTVGFGASLGPIATTQTQVLTHTEYQRHLHSDGSDAAWSLGLCPLRNDNTVRFGALDFDAKDLHEDEARGLIGRAGELGLPLAWTRSRSGSLHAWLFLMEPADPVSVRRLLTHFGHLLGWTDRPQGSSKARGDRFFEVFPKQEHLADDKLGSWIRLPWPGGEQAQGRRGEWLCDRRMTFTAWLMSAMQHRVTLNQLTHLLEAIPNYDTKHDAQTSGADVANIAADISSPPGAIRGSENRFPVEAVPSLLAALPSSDAIGRDTWLRVCMGLHHEYAGTSDEATALGYFDEWSATAGPPTYEGTADVEATWQSLRRDGDGKRRPVTIASILARARKQGWVPPDLQAELAELNLRWALVLRGGNTILETPPASEPRFHEMRRWKPYMSNRRALDPETNKVAPLVNIWMKWRLRRSYHSVVFDPNLPPWAGVPSNHGGQADQDFNLWPGLALAASPEGSCDLFLAHLLNVVCNDDECLYQWLLQWLAHMVQEPTRLAGTAVALRGAQGAGKSLVGEVMGEIVGASLYAKVSKPDELTGRFNAHQQGRLLLQVEEGFWAGDKKAEGGLKHMITSPTIRIEPKFVDSFEIPNYARLLVTSNKDWVVPAGFGERRFAVLDVSDARANDLVYFRALREEMFAKGGCARFLYYLLHEVAVNWDAIRRPPATSALLEQQVEALGPEDTWLLDILTSGDLPGDLKGNGQVLKSDLLANFQPFMRGCGQGRRASEVNLGKHLRKRLGSCVRSDRSSRSNDAQQRPYLYVFAPLAECRAAFAAKLALTPEWSDVDRWQAPESLFSLGRSEL
jgi:hypothetical protein